jgi:uncharacterized protein (TIGR03067 family)
MLPILGLLCLTVGQPNQPIDAAQEQLNAAKEELSKFQGSWTIELQEDDGKKLSEAELKGRTISFGSNLFLVRKKAAMEQIGKFKIDHAKKSINVNVEKGPHAGDPLPGFYELDGDTLKICLSTDGDSRPKDFKGGPDRLLMICKRVPAKAGEKDLSGKYKSDSVDISGKHFRYDTTIERMGDAYLVLYAVQGKLVYFGTGVRKGNVFAVGWMSQGRAGVTLYQIEEGNRMVGEFADVGGAGFLGTETLTPAPKDGIQLDARAGRVPR